MAEAFARVPVTFDSECLTAGDFARRFRVMAALSEGGVSFTMAPEQLRAWASVMDRVGTAPELCVAVIETEKPLGRIVAVALAFMLATQAMIFGEVVARILWGMAG